MTSLSKTQMDSYTWACVAGAGLFIAQNYEDARAWGERASPKFHIYIYIYWQRFRIKPIHPINEPAG